MTNYSPRWIDDGTYIIGNSEYGYDLCRIDFYKNLREKLSSEQQDILANDIAGKIILALESAAQ